MVLRLFGHLFCEHFFSIRFRSSDDQFPARWELNKKNYDSRFGLLNYYFRMHEIIILKQ
jgi:hypothetical protein